MYTTLVNLRGVAMLALFVLFALAQFALSPGTGLFNKYPIRQ